MAPPRRARRAGAAAAGGGVLALGGLALGVSALTSGLTPPADTGPAVRLALRVPDPLLAAVAVLLGVAALLLVALLRPWRRPRRRKGDDEFELVSELPKASPWGIVLMLVLAVAPFGALGYAVWVGWAPDPAWLAGGPSSSSRAAGGSSSAASPAPLPPPSPEPPTASAPGFSRAIGLVALLAALGTLGLMVWVWLGDRLAGTRAIPREASQATERLVAAVAEGLDDLRRESDPRRAIILCYRRFEAWLTEAGCPRAPWETPTEFLRRVLVRSSMPPEATRTLTRLFERSRFSQHVLGPADRECALRALGEIRAVLEAARADAATA